MPVPVVGPNTILAAFPETWNALVEAAKAMRTTVATLTSYGITTYGDLVEFMKSKGYNPVYLQTVTETFAGWSKSSPVDPANTTDVGFRVATDIGVTGGAGTAVSTFTSGGNRTLGLVTKMVALGACLSLLVSEIGAGLVADDIQADLITSIDPYTIDGENVPVLIDEYGKTHLMEDMIEAVRAKAVELGLYDAETESVLPDRVTLQYSSNGTNWSDITTQYILDGLPPNASMRDIRFPSDGISFLRNDRATITLTVTNPQNCFFVIAKRDRFLEIAITRKTGDNSVMRLLVDGQQVSTYYFNGITSGYYKYNGEVKKASDYLNGTLYWNSTAAANPAEVVSRYGSTITNLNSSTDLATIYSLFSTFEEVGGVEGMTPNSQTEALLKDLTNPFTAAFPNIGTGLDTASPTESDLTHKTKWYPVNVKHVNPFTDGLTTTDTDTSTVTDGDTDTDTEDEIIELLKGLYEALNRDPEDPTQPVPPPTIEVSDNGDTPPSNPPLISGSANGLWKIYNPLEADIQAFGSWLWSSSVIDQVVRMFNSPIDAVIALHQIYCTPVRGASANIMCGFLDSGVPSTYTVANQYQTIDCGDVNVGEYYRTAVDYVATKIELYLPFIGIVPLSASVVMGSTLNVTYRIDVLTGTCLAQVKVIKQNSDAVMYTFAGNCACQIPLTATTYTGMVGTLVNSVQAGLSFMAGDIIQGAGEIGSALRDGMTGLTGTKKSGSLGANAGALGIRIPYLIITHPTVYEAYLYNEQYGYPSNKTVRLGSVSGYTKVKDIHLSGVPCTDEELAEIERLLKNGVIIN